MEWLAKIFPALTGKALGGLWGLLSSRLYGDREIAANFRLDILAIYENGPAVLRIKPLAPVDRVQVQTIRVLSDGDWVLHPMGQRSHDGTHLAEFGGKWGPELVVKLTVTDLMTAQGPYADNSFSFLAGIQDRTVLQDGQTSLSFGPLRGTSQGTSMTLSKEIQIEVTLCLIADNRRETFIRLKSQPIEEAKLIPSKTP